MKAIAVVGARLNSSRLPKKHLLPLAGKPMIQRIWERLKACEQITSSILATTADAYNAPLVAWAQTNGVSVYAHSGDVNDLMGRITAVVDRWQPDIIVYICGDCPLVEPSLIDRAISLLKSHPEGEVVHFSSDQPLIHEGLLFYSKQGWLKLQHLSNTPTAREHVGYGARGHENDFRAILEREDPMFCCIQHRISVDTHADYRFMSEVYERWYHQNGPDTIVELAWVIQQLLSDNALRAINEHVVQRQADTTYDNISIFCQAGKGVGVGHLSRMQTVASIINEQLGMSVKINVLGEPFEAAFIKSNIHWYASDTAFYDAMAQTTDALLIIDMNPAFCDLQKIKRIVQHRTSELKKTIAFDQLTCLVNDVDWVYVPSYYVETEHPKISYGWQNYLLPKPPIRKRKKQIVILTGGSDAFGFGKTLPKVLECLNLADWNVIWVQGPLAERPILSKDSLIKVINNPPEGLTPLLAKSEIALSTYGNSLFECLNCGVATILLPTPNIKTEELNRLTEESICMISPTIDDVAGGLEVLIRTETLREKYQAQCNQRFNQNNTGACLVTGLNKMLEITLPAGKQIQR